MPRTGSTHALLEAPQRLATDTQRCRLFPLAVGSRPRAIEDAITGRLQQTDLMMLTELGQTLNGTLLGSKLRLADHFGLEPVEVVSKVDQGIGARVIQQLSEAGGVPA